MDDVSSWNWLDYITLGYESDWNLSTGAIKDISFSALRREARREKTRNARQKPNQSVLFTRGKTPFFPYSTLVTP